jgi:hypothetical protein
MLVSGFWHGTGITFIVWGLLYGVFVAIPPLIHSLRKNKPSDGSTQEAKVMQPVKIVLTLVLVSFSWIFFRAKTLSDAFFIISSIGGTLKLVVLDIARLGEPREVLSQIMVRLPYAQVFILPVFIFVAFGVEYLREKSDFLKSLSNQPALVRWSAYIVLVAMIMIFGVHGFSEISQFIYFRF